MTDRPTLALAMIVRDGGPLLRQCLKSIAPHVDEIVIALDTRTTDRSAAIARRYGAKVYRYQWQRDDFAAARNFSFSKVTCDWVFWCDHDDVIENGARLRQLITSVGSDIGGIWLPYLYAFDDQGNPNTVLDRERVLRMSVGWQWQGRLHEVVVPSRPVQWARDDQVVLVHYGGATSKSSRNLPILLEWLSEEPENIRIKLFLGNQYFADGDWRKAYRWYREFYTDPKSGWYDRYQAATYAARAAREMGQLVEAEHADWTAARIMPGWADAWIGIAETALLQGDAMRALTYCQIAEQRDPADRIVMVNPLDYTVRLNNIKAEALLRLNRLEEARDALQEALSVRPQDENLKRTLERLEASIERNTKAKAFVEIAGSLDDEGVLKVAETLHNGVLSAQAVRDVLMPVVLRKAARGTQPRCLVFCGPTIEQWADPTPEEKGIGGSETAVVEISRRMAKDGWAVQVYNDCGEMEGPHGGVLYVDWHRWREEAAKGAELLVVWRDPFLVQQRPETRQVWAWLHDLDHGEEGLGAPWQNYDRVYGVSQWHADYLRRVYGLPEEQVGHLYNGVRLEVFQKEAQAVKRQPFKCVYTSSPDRGLLNLLRMWPTVKQAEPAAELHVFYGWAGVDYRIRQGDGFYIMLKAQLQKELRQPGVFWRGRVPQGELARELLSADLWLYPTGFMEVFCINAVEAMAAGCYPVATKLAALPEVIGDAAPLVEGLPGVGDYSFRWLDLCFRFLLDVETRLVYRGKGQLRAQQFSWDKAYQECWLPNLTQAVRT